MRKLFLYFLLCCLIFIGTVQASNYSGIGGKPAYPNKDNPYSKNWFIYTIHPGETLEDAISVQNSSDEAVDLILYPADSTPSTDGGFALEQFVEPRDFVGKWVTLSESELTLGRQESKIVPFTIAVPNDPKLDVGEHTGGILIQRAENEPENAGGLRLLTRVGVRIYVTIPGEKIKALAIENIEVTLDEEKSVYIAHTTLNNSGNVSQDVVIDTKISSVSSPFLASLLKHDKTLPIENSKKLQVLRNDTLISKIEFPRPLFGKLELQTSVTNEDGEVFTSDPITIHVPLDKSMVILLWLVAAFAASLLAVLALKKYSYQQVSRPKRRRR